MPEAVLRQVAASQSPGHGQEAVLGHPPPAPAVAHEPGPVLRPTPPAPAPGHGQGSHCHKCRKLIVWPGLCYTCATSRPRLIVRPEERLSPTTPDDEAEADGLAPDPAA